MNNKRKMKKKWWWKTWISTCKRLKLEPWVSPWTNTNSK
jgi:hypothetical protein